MNDCTSKQSQYEVSETVHAQRHWQQRSPQKRAYGEDALASDVHFRAGHNRRLWSELYKVSLSVSYHIHVVCLKKLQHPELKEFYMFVRKACRIFLISIHVDILE